MGKRRDSSKCYASGGGNAMAGQGYGVGGGGGKFSVFEFDAVDMRVESESRKTLAKYGKKSPTKKFVHHRQLGDNYLFLQSFARGEVTPQNHLLWGSECSPCGAISPLQGRGDSKGHTTNQQCYEVHYVESDEDECTDLKSPTSSNLADAKGLIEEQSSDSGKYSENNDCEPVVFVYPTYVKYGNNYYTKCLVAFSQSWIRLEGSPHCDRDRSYRFEWSNFDSLKIECQQCESVGADVVNLLLISKVMNAAETGNWSSALQLVPSLLPPDAGCEELEFAVLNDPHWLKKQEEIKSLGLQYKSAWKTITSVCSVNESFEDIIYPEGDPDAVFLSRGDIELLQPKTFINDTLVDFYIKYLLTKIKPEEQHRFYCFNTFFFRKFVGMDQDQYRTWNEGEAFQRVRKWTRNVNLFEKDYIVMPINYSLHWSVIIICHPGEVAGIRDDPMNNSSKVPCILHMDSIRGSHRGLKNVIKRYLWEEWKERCNKHGDQIEEKFRNIDFVEPQVPQQENFYDCGLFLLHYVELFLEKASNTSTPNFDLLNEDWFHPAEVSLKKRDQIRNLIYRIAKNQVLKYPPATCDDKYPDSVKSGGDDDAQSFQGNGVKESCLRDGVHKFKAQLQTIDYVSDESCQPCKPLVPVNEFSNMWLPMEEEGPERQNTSPPQDTTMSCESREDEPMPPSQQPSGFMTGEMKVSRGSSEAWCGESPNACYVQNDEEDCTSGEGEKGGYEIPSSLSDEDHSLYIVEDSEDDSVTESRRTRESILFGPYAN